MADKKITDLSLIAAVTSGLSVPSDDGIQSYRFTAAQMQAFILAAGNVGLSALALDIFNGLTQVTADDADFFILNDTSDSNRTKKALVSTFARNTYAAISGTTSISNAGTYKITGASATITLPTAIGFSGKIKLVHQGTSLTQIYTLATTSGQTIGGVASGSYSLYTFNEMIEIESDGANWIIIGRSTATNWINAGALTVTASGSNPTKASTVILDSFKWKRRDTGIDYIYNYDQGAATGAGSGSGDYFHGMPANLNIDTSVIPQNTTIGANSGTDPSNMGVVGAGIPSVTAGVGYVSCFDQTRFRLIIGTSGTVQSQSSGWYTYTSAGLMYTAHGFMPISGWQP